MTKYWKIGSLYGLGKKTSFPGTLASFVCLIFSFLSFYFLNKSLHTVLFTLFLALGYLAVDKIVKENGGLDSPAIVIDEWIGLWLGSFFLFEVSGNFTQKIFVALAMFVIFRLLDIFKFIPPTNTIDKIKKQTAYTVILDDMLSGIYSYVILGILLKVYNLNYLLLAILILLPAMVANMTPVLLKKVPVLNTPISKKIFGDNKTWRGLVGGTLSGTLFYYFLIKMVAVNQIPNLSFVFLLGFLLSFGALAGDLVKSFIKRKAGIPPSESFSPWDQIDYVLGALFMTCFFFHYTFSFVVLSLVVGGTLSALAHRLAYMLKMINTKS